MGACTRRTRLQSRGLPKGSADQYPLAGPPDPALSQGALVQPTAAGNRRHGIPEAAQMPDVHTELVESRLAFLAEVDGLSGMSESALLAVQAAFQA